MLVFYIIATAMQSVQIAKSILFFLAAGLLELGGAYLIWLWARGSRSPWFALAGAVVLTAYGLVHTLQPATYGRIQAAYSGFFITMALLWGWQVERVRPDRFDLIGAVIVLAGVSVIMYWPRA